MLTAPLSAWLALGSRVLLQTAIAPLLKSLNRGQSVVAVTCAFSILGFALLLPFLLYGYLTDPGYLRGIAGYLDNAAASGLIFCIAIIALNRGLRMGDVNLLVPLTSLSLVIVYCFDLLLGNVERALLPALGILVVVLGVTILNIGPGVRLSYVLNPMNVVRQPGAGGALIFALGVSACRVIDHNAMHSLPAPPPILYAALANVFVTVYGFGILAVRRSLHRYPALWRAKPVLTLGTGVVGIANYLCMLHAYGHFPPSFMETVTQLSVILSVAVGTIWLGEPLRWRWAAALLVAGGAVLVVLSGRA